MNIEEVKAIAKTSPKNFLEHMGNHFGLKVDRHGGYQDRDLPIQKNTLDYFVSKSEDLVFFSSKEFMGTVEKIEKKVNYKLFGDS